MRRPYEEGPVLTSVLLLAVLLIGCTSKQPEPTPTAPADMQLLAVLPIESAATAPGSAGSSAPGEDAGLSVTAQLYRVLADQTEFRVVPDLSVTDVLETPAVRRAGSLLERAVALGKEVGADGVIFGRVLRYRNRVGTERGVTESASVAFELSVVVVSSGTVLWQGSFDRTQESLGASMLDWVMFWNPPPRWISAAELTGQGVDQLFGDMTAAINAAG